MLFFVQKSYSQAIRLFEYFRVGSLLDFCGLVCRAIHDTNWRNAIHTVTESGSAFCMRAMQPTSLPILGWMRRGFSMANFSI